MHTRNEQQLLSNVKSIWIVELKASFQEDDYLYLVMEYLPGGDYAPFCSKDTNEVCYKILNWQKYLKKPSKVKLSKEAEDLIKNLSIIQMRD